MDRGRVKATALDADHNDGTYIQRSVNSVVLAVERGIPCFATSPRCSEASSNRKGTGGLIMFERANFTWWSGSFSPLPPEAARWSGAYDQVHSPAGQNRNGAVASAVPSALTRGSAHFDWQLAGATRSGAAGGETCTRSNCKDTPYRPTAAMLVSGASRADKSD